MSAVLVAHALAAAAYAGFQWTVRVVVYPQMAGVPAPASAAYQAAHQRRVVLLVAPLFAALVLTTGALVVTRPGPAALAAAACTAVVLGATAFGAVPQHRVLEHGFDAGAHRRLLRWDAVRVVAASAQAALGASLLLR